MFLLLSISSPVFIPSFHWKCSSTWTRTHSFTWLLNKNLFKNKFRRTCTHLLVMPRGPQLLAGVLKTQAVREKGQRSMLAVDSYYSPILSFSQDQWARWLSENEKREKERLRERVRVSERHPPYSSKPKWQTDPPPQSFNLPTDDTREESPQPCWVSGLFTNQKRDLLLDFSFLILNEQRHSMSNCKNKQKMFFLISIFVFFIQTKKKSKHF